MSCGGLSKWGRRGLYGSMRNYFSVGSRGGIMLLYKKIALQNSLCAPTIVIPEQKRQCSSNSSSSSSGSSSSRSSSSNSKSSKEHKVDLKRKVMSYFDLNNKEIWTIPNIITVSRIASSPLLALTIAYDMKMVSFAGCVLFGFSDWLDGYIAKNYNQMTVLGAFLDPVADKCLITALTLGLTAKGFLPVALACTFVGRDVALIGLSTYVRWKEKPSNAPFFDTTHSATFEIVPSELSKVNTFLQLVLLTSTMSYFSFGAPSLVYVEPLYWISAVTTITSGVSYLDGSGIRRLSETGIGRGHDDFERKRGFYDR